MTQSQIRRWSIGEVIEGTPRSVTQETITRYGELNGDNDIVHYDDAFARAAGFHAPIAHGLMALGYLSETLREAWGLAWLTSGSVEIRWIGAVYPGDAVSPRARITAIEQEGDGVRLSADAWCEDQAGRVLLTGTVSVWVA